MKTKSFSKSKLRNLEHFQFAQNVLNLCREANIGKLNAVLTPLEKALKEEDLLLNPERKDPHTQELARLDYERGNAWRMIALRVQADRLSKKADVASAARLVNDVLSRYPRLIHRPYSQETGGTTNLVTDLRSTAITPAVQKLGLKELIDNLDAINKAFQTLYLQRLKSVSYEAGPDIRQRRTETDGTIQAVTDRMDALHNLEASEAIKQLIMVYNNLVIKQNRELARRKAYGRVATANRRAAIEELLRPVLPALITDEGMTVAFAGRTLGTGKNRHYLITFYMDGAEVDDRWYRIEEEKLVHVPEDQLPKPKKKKKPASDFLSVPTEETTPTPPAQGGGSSGNPGSGAEGSIGGGL
ncbi:DUF6261 family protein [Porphyromonas loveana]|uniref:DUF6261 family protein n=1 Tax=Porphyromonas loveana TaxID=1884669 RepID=UPI00359F3AE6